MDLFESLRGWARRLASGAALPTAEGPPPWLADLATSLWRLRRLLPSGGGAGRPEDLRRLERHAEAMWDILAQAGVRIQDHTGAAFDSGQVLKVLDFQETPGLEREKVIETAKPSVYHQGRPIQKGEVIVGKPAASRLQEKPPEGEAHG